MRHDLGAWWNRLVASTDHFVDHPETLPITEARARFGSLVRRASHARERITITDHGQPAAVVINPQELADLEDALALAQYRARQAAGENTAVPQDEVRARLGLERHAS